MNVQIAPGDAGRLPPRTANLRIDYAALSFVAPEKVRFRLSDGGVRYRLGRRRHASPGFLHEPAARRLSIPGRGQQRRRIERARGRLGLHARAGVLSDAMVCRPCWPSGAERCGARVAGPCAAGAGRFSAILVERTRVAREIHDTLLQSLLGVMFRLDEVANVIDVSSESAKAQLVRLRHQVEFYVREARYSIRDLRSPILQSRGLATAMRAVGENLTGDERWPFAGRRRDAPPDLQRIDEHLLRIGQEAITNAVRHGKAATVGSS